MKILVTGGAGFIGSHVIEALRGNGHEVAALDNLSTGRRENLASDVPLYEVDLRDRAATFRAISDFRPEVVSHQAAQASVTISVRDPRLDAEVNLVGGLNLLDACTELRAPVERLVFASTGGAIYGEVPEVQCADEDTPPKPMSPYAIHKLAFEQLLAVYAVHRGLKNTVLRYANVYGPRQDPHGEAGVVAIFFDRARDAVALCVNGRKEAGDEGCVRDYVFVSDVARANLLALSGDIREAVLNIGTGVPTTTRVLAETIRQISHGEAKIAFGPPRAGDLERSVLDPTRAVRVLGPLVSLEEGLQRTHAHYATLRS